MCSKNMQKQAQNKRYSFSPRTIFSPAVLIPLCCAAVYLLCLDILRVNAGMLHSVRASIIPAEQTALPETPDCIVIPGASIRSGSEPSPMLEDRLLAGLHVYELSGIPKFLMSGDHALDYYNEVDVMKRYAVERGVPSENIFMDHSGFSTYETMFRAKHIFQAQTIIFVSQRYHLYRGLYIARELGITAHGVEAPFKPYNGEFKRTVREILARYKDYYLCLFRYTPHTDEPIETIPISGNGNRTNMK